MNDDKILSRLNGESGKKTIILMSVIAIVLFIIMMVIFFFYKPNTSEKESGNDLSNIDTSLIGEASTDPENMDLFTEDGTQVKADQLVSIENRSNGIDVSKWQGKIDWAKVKENGIEFALIRIGYRGENGTIYKDDHADYNIQQAQKAGVLVGVYFFSTATTEAEAVEEANWTIKAVESYSISYPVVYDCEGFQQANSRMYALSKETRTRHAIVYLDQVADAGYDTMFYAALSEVQDQKDWNVSEIAQKHKIWIAQYTRAPYPTKETPDYTGAVHAWQYTNKGSIPGVSGNVDMVVCYFRNEKAEPKNPSKKPPAAKVPLTEEEKIYESVTETVTAKEVTNLRSAATTKSDIVASLNNGQTAKRIGIGKNGWSKLEYDGKIVYAITSYLTTDLSFEAKPEADIVSGNTFTSKNDSVTAKDEVNLRSLPTTDSEIVGKLVSGTFVNRTAVSDKGWSRLTYNGKTVYAVTSYLSNEVVSTEPDAPELPSDGFSPVNEQVTAKEETNLRTKPSTQDSEVVHLLKHGEYVTRIGVHSNGWSKLQYNGQTVYAITSYLTK